MKKLMLLMVLITGLFAKQNVHDTCHLYTKAIGTETRFSKAWVQMYCIEGQKYLRSDNGVWVPITRTGFNKDCECNKGK